MSVDMRKAVISMIKETNEQAARDGLPGVFEEAELYLAPDCSGSMGRFYGDPKQPVTKLAEQVLSLALAEDPASGRRPLDANGEVPIVCWHTRPAKPVIATEANLHGKQGRLRNAPPIIDQAVKAAGVGGTDLARVIDVLAEMHRDTGMSKPGLAVIQTDGEPDNEATAEVAIANASDINLFFVIIKYGAMSPFVKKLNAGGFPDQVVDNVYAFEAGNDPASMSNETLYRELLSEIPQWRNDARGKVQGTV